MKARETAVILATGGMGLVRAAYSAGKPAYGVGPGQCACIYRIDCGRRQGRPGHRHRQDVRQRPAVLVRELGRLRRRPRGGSEAAVRRQRRPLPVGGGDRRAWARCSSPRSGCPIRSWSGGRPRYRGAGRDPRAAWHPRADCGTVGRRPRLSLSRSRSSAPCSRSMSSRTGGRGASAASRSSGTAGWATPCRSTPGMTTSFCSSGLKKPAFRIVVNTPTTLGSIGLTTGLDPSMTLGCGGYGGNITSDNISPRHLLNIKRLAYETSPGASACGRQRRRRRPFRGRPNRRECRADWRPSRWPGASTSFCRLVDTRRRHRPRRRRASGAGAGSPQILPHLRPSSPTGVRAVRRAGPECPKTSRVRVRRRRSAGRSAGAQDRHRGANHRHAGGAGPRRAAPCVRAGELAIAKRFRRLLLRRLGLRLTGDELGWYAFYPSNREDLAPERAWQTEQGGEFANSTASSTARPSNLNGPPGPHPRPGSGTPARTRCWRTVERAGARSQGIPSGAVVCVVPESRGSAQYDVTCMAAGSGSSRDQLGPRGRVRLEPEAEPQRRSRRRRPRPAVAPLPPCPDPIAALIETSQKHFEAGERELKVGHLEQARGGVRPRRRRHARVPVWRADRCAHSRTFRSPHRSDQRLRSDGARPG